MRRGGPAFKLEYPHRLGSDIVGVVDAVGAGVAGVAGRRAGRRAAGPVVRAVRARASSGHDNLCRYYKILGENTQGGYAEYIVVPAGNLAPYPEPASTYAHAAASLLTFMTAWQMVVHKARVAPGDTVLVHGAGSGVGVAAIQIAKLYGARVIATAGSADKLARATRARRGRT